MNHEKYAWALLSVFILLIALAPSITNYCIDCANRLHPISYNVCKEIIAGNNVSVASGNMDERTFKAELIKMLPETMNSVAIGSSVIMTLNSEILSDESFYNLGISSASIMDFANTMGLLAYYNKKAETYIFCIEPGTFCREISEKNGFYKKYKAYGYWYLQSLNSTGREKAKIKDIDNVFSRIETALSIKYFQDNIGYIKVNKKFSINPRYVAGESDFNTSYYCSDASYVYAKQYQNSTRTKTQAVQWESYHLDEEYKEIFSKIITTIINKGSDIILYYAPFPPAFWEEIQKVNCPIISELEKLGDDYKANEHVVIYGSFSPYDLSLNDDNFYDSRHVRREDMGIAYKELK